MSKRILTAGLNVREKFVIENSLSVQWFPGHMKRGLNQIQSALRNIDAVLEIHDARIPFSGRNAQLREIVHVRPHVLILNKCDLADMSHKDAIENKLKDEGINNIQFTTGIGKDITKRVQRDIVPMMLSDIQSRPRFRTDITNAYNIMVIGIPNVGKSTLLNKLREAYTKRGKCARVGAMPGVTRSVMNKVKVNFDPEMYVVDTPGILNPKIPNLDMGMRLALCDCLPNRLIGDDIIADYLLFWLNKHQNFSYVDVYNLRGPTDNCLDFLAEIALQNKFVVKFSENKYSEKSQYRIDFMKAAYTVIKDFQSGRFGKVLLDDDALLLN